MQRVSWTAILAVAVVSVSRLGAEGTPSYTLFVENDKFAGTDQYYTSGQRIAALRENVSRAPRWARGLAERFPRCGDGSPAGGDPERCYQLNRGWTLSLLIYTPEDITQPALQVDDRPYGGWLHATSVVEMRNRTALHRFELGLGLVGDHSFADDAQTKLHELIDSPEPRGWHHQLQDEPTLQLYYRFRRTVFERRDTSGRVTHFDVSPHTALAAGNAFTFAAAGFTVRAGYNVGDPFPQVIAPEAAVTEPAAAPPFSAYVFVLAEGRIVARNIFLDGNTFEDSHRVDKETFVNDLGLGAALAYRRLVLTYTLMRRSPEFTLQPQEQHFASISLTLRSRL